MGNHLINAWETAEVYAWLVHDEFPAGVTGCLPDETKRTSSARFSRNGHGIRRLMKTTDNYLQKGGK